MNVFWSTPRGRWDHRIITQALDRIPYTDYNAPPPTDEGVVAILSHKVSDEVTKQLRDYPWVLAIHTSDESHEWDAEQIRRPGVKIWMQYPNEKHQGDRNILIGCPEDTQKLMPERKPLKERRLDWCFAGQAFTDNRKAMLNSLQGNGEAHVSDRFSGGLPREQYFKLLTESRIALCPSGTVHPDSFRLYEAIEAGAYPIVDSPLFWEQMKVPVLAVNDWSELPYILKTLLNDVDSLQRKTDALGMWWNNYQDRVRDWILEDTCKLCNTV